MGMPEIIRLEASAGSGKTYALSLRYLNLLSHILRGAQERKMERPGYVCNRKTAPDPQPDSLSAILAITFTNKAAAEMKERILLILKTIALRGNPPKGLTLAPSEAEAMLFRLIENFSYFNVMTIDAFMNTILKAFAVEVGRFPGYELNFNFRKLYTLTLDHLMIREEAHPAFRAFLDHLLKTERAKGFNPEAMIRKALVDLRNKGIFPRNLKVETPSGFDEAGAWETLRARLASFYTDLLKIQETENCFNARSVKPEKHLAALAGREFPAWITDGRELSTLLKKGKSCPIFPELERRLEAIREGLQRFFTRLAIHKFHQAMEAYRLTLREEAALYRDLNLFDGTRLPEKIQDLLRGDPGFYVPAAFCRLGERYVHYLIDEFQDTSRGQWDGMTPLVENSLSEGGSLFYVGDPKQAIYGWRGGDYRLMEEAFHLMPPAWDEYRHTYPLKVNWRSRENLVLFFNTLFDPEGFEAALAPLLKDVSCLNDLRVVYKNSRQEVKKDKAGGYIHACFLPEAQENMDPQAPVREAFFQALSEARRGTPDREILVLGRKNEEIEMVAGWLFERPEPIPFITEQSLKLFTLPPIRSLLHLLSYLSSPNRDLYLQTLVHGGLFGTLSREEVEVLFYRFTPGTPFEPFFLSEYPEWRDLMEHLREASIRLTPYELTREILTLLRISERFPGSRPLLDRFLEQVLLQEQKGVFHLQDVVTAFYESAEETHLVLPEAPEAIRLMTIHKAKGLEAGVVILPFLNWQMVSSVEGEIIELARGRYARLTGELCRFDPLVERKREELRRETFIENFNLFYVALTRAREALYLCVPPRARGLGIGEIFRSLALHHGYLTETADAFTVGHPRAVRGRHPRTAPSPSQETLGVSAQDIRRHLRFPPEDTKETWLDERARRFGNIAHMAFHYLRVLPPDFPPEVTALRALETAMRRMGMVLNEEIRLALQQRLASALRDLREYFVGVDEVWTEKELVTRGGEIIRVDRLVRRENAFYLLEFKTGEKGRPHVSQVRHYLRVLRSLGISGDPYGILYYLETGETLRV